MTIQLLILQLLHFINNTLVPFILAVAFLIFIWNIARYFIIQTPSDETRKAAKRTALYGIAAFVLIASLWGIVNLVVKDAGFNTDTPLTPDYIEETGGPRCIDGQICTTDQNGYRSCFAC